MDYCGAVIRNIDDEKRRSARRWADPTAAPEDPAKPPDGTVAEAPQADVIAPAAFALLVPPSAGRCDRTSLPSSAHLLYWYPGALS